MPSMIALALTLIGLFLIYVLLQWLQTRLIFVPRSRAVTDGLPSLPYQILHVPTELASRWIEAWWMPNADQPTPLVVFCHGNSGNLSGRNHVSRMELVRNAGFSVIGFDYTGYGNTSGSPSEWACYANTDAVIHHLMHVYHYKPSDMILYGHSLGGAVAIHAAWKWSRRNVLFRGLLTECTFSRMADMIGHFCKPLKYVAPYILSHKFDSQAKVAEIQCPCIHIHSRHDTFIPYTHVFQLQNPKETSNIQIIEDEGADHNNLPIRAPNVIVKALTQFAHGK
jgi:pimeloyl-ACP methyl ester carboxylesterase